MLLLPGAVKSKGKFAHCRVPFTKKLLVQCKEEFDRFAFSTTRVP